MELTKYKLGDVCTFINGRAYSQPELLDSGKYKVLRVGNIFDGNHWYYSDMELEEDKYCNEGDLLYSWACTFGPYIWHGPKTIYHYHIWKVKPNDSLVDKSFLYYFLNHQTKGFMGSTHGSTMIHITKENMENFEVLLPSLKDQKKIASVLSALDDKIALNKKMNQKLERMAKRLYDYWFVQFDFPDKNGHPYKTTGGPMTYNPTLKREIPEGWEVSNICPLMEILPGGTPSKAKPEYWNGDIPFFGPTDYCGGVFQLSTEECITENGLNNCASALYPPKTIFITARGSVGKLIVCGKPMAMNQSCYALKPFDLEKYEYLFYLTKQLIEQLKKKGSGSVFKSINTLDIEQSFMSVAPNEIIDLYCKKVKSIFERIKSNTVEIAKLTALRDKLLPLLMNGQVTIK